MGTHIPYGITQCYLPPGRGEIPAFTLAKAGVKTVPDLWSSETKTNTNFCHPKE